MSSLVWDIIIIVAVVLIFIIFVRRLPKAVKHEREAKAEMTPQKIVSYGLMAQADDAYEAKDFDKAEELYIKVAATEPNNAKVYGQLGQIYLDRNNFYDAKEAYSQSVKHEAGVAQYHANLGLAYIGLKDYFKASQAFVKAVEIEPKEKTYHNLFEKAQKALEREKKRKK